MSGYLVKRYDAGTLAAQTILTSCAGTITATTCTEQSVPSGNWKYAVTPVFATNWQAVESAKGATITTNDAPVLVASGGTTAHTENVPVVVDSGITVSDADNSNMASGTVTVGAGYSAGQDVLGFTTQNGITGVYNAPTMTLTGSATKANWQTALRSVTYNNTSDTPDTGNRTLNFAVNDGAANSNTAAKTVSVTAVNDAPVLAASGGTTAHTENVPVVVDSGITVSDADSANMVSGTVTVGAGYTAGQDILGFTTQNGITGVYNAPTMTLTGSATRVNWRTALRSVTYSTGDAPDTGNRTLNFVVNDGTANSNTAAKTVSVTAVNDAPVNGVPGAQTTGTSAAKVFSTGNGNLISISDDATSGEVQVQLVSTNGTTALSGTAGLTFTGGANGTATHDLHRHRLRRQHRPGGAGLHPDRGRACQPADHHQRPGQHRWRRPERHRHDRHHRRLRPVHQRPQRRRRGGRTDLFNLCVRGLHGGRQRSRHRGHQRPVPLPLQVVDRRRHHHRQGHRLATARPWRESCSARPPAPTASTR